MAIPQTSLTSAVGLAQEGQLVHSHNSNVQSFPADTTTAPGRACVVNSDGEAAVPTAIAADVDFFVLQATDIIGAVATTYSGAGFDGAYVAGDIINPPRRVTLTLTTSDADTPSGTMTVTGLDANGVLTTEEVAIAANATQTVETNTFFSRVDSIVTPAADSGGNDAAPGSLGVSADVGGPFKAEGISVLDVTREAANYAAGESVPLCRSGQIYVISENAVKRGDQVYVRLVAGVGEALGALRGDAASGDATPLEGWKFAGSTTSTDQVVLIERV